MEALIGLQGWLREGAMNGLRALQTEGLTAAPSLILAAFGFGLLHALLPGHGKLLLAAHYAGRGPWREALLSSAILIMTHVGSAIIIVLAGFALIERTIGRAGRALVIERLSAVLIIVIGLALLWQALRSGGKDRHRSGTLLAVAGGLTPCPLTAFAMTYAVTQGAITAGLILSGGFALGMIVTVAVFPVVAVLLRRSALQWSPERWTSRLARALLAVTATAVIIIGVMSWR
jgi:nickel/cobalt transporter (NicO) family protein